MELNVYAEHTICIRDQEESYRRVIVGRNYQTKRHYIDFFVSNYKEYEGKEIIEFLSKNEPLRLERDNNYPYDQFATAVYSNDCVKLGYIPSIVSPLISYHMENKKINAVIKNVKPEVDDECKIEIRVFIDEIKKNKIS